MSITSIRDKLQELLKYFLYTIKSTFKMITDAVHILNDSNSESDQTYCRNPSTLNSNSFKKEVLAILQEVTQFMPERLNDNNEINSSVSCETDGSPVAKLVEHTPFRKRRKLVDAPMDRSQHLLSAEVKTLAERKDACKMKFLSLINDWNSDSKLVYGLQHQYSKADCLFENLKKADKSVANFLLDTANSSDLKVFLAQFNKTSVSQYHSFNRTGYEYDSANFYPDDDDECETSNIYTVKDFVSTNGNRLITTSLVNVNLDREVVLEDCFDKIKLYRETSEPTGNTSIKICRYYRCAAIVMFPMRYFLEILKKYGSSAMDIDMVFMNEAEILQNNQRIRKILLTWAQHILSSNHAKSLRMIKAIVALENLATIQMLFSRCVILNEASILVVESVCERYGWALFSLEMSTMFNKLSKRMAIQLLTKLVTGSRGLQTEKHTILCDVFRVILDKSNDELQPQSAWYAQSAHSQDKTEKMIEEQDILLSICQLAEKLSYNILSFAKTKSSAVFVPVLLLLVPNKETKINAHWLEVCQYFLNIMEVDATKPLEIPNWKRHDTTSCFCADCSMLNSFLQSDKESITLKMGKVRRRHLHEKMNAMENIIHEADRGGLSAVLVVTKTTKAGYNDEENQKFSKTYLDRLRSITPI